MAKFIAKRVGVSIMMLLFASLIVFVLTIHAGDPLADLRESTAPNREHLMSQRTEMMGLDLPWYTRYWNWLSGVLGCFKGECNLGLNRSGQEVAQLVSNAAVTSIRLVFLSTVLSIVFGIFFGMLTAIRQYSGLDYAVTFVAFVLYSLPTFVFAVLLKEYGAIRFNNWLRDPTISIVTSIIIALVFAVFLQAILAGGRKRRLMTTGITFAILFCVLQFLSVTQWFAKPMTGWFIQLIVGLAAAVLFTSLFTGIGNKTVLRTSLVTAGITSAITLGLEITGILWKPNWGLLMLVGLAVAVIGALVGYFFGGFARKSAAWIGVWTSLSVVAAATFDFCLRHWTKYLGLVNNRPISTIGSVTPNFRGTGDFWLELLDMLTHLILPTLSLTLLSLAAYTRYTRSSMLDVLNQDYVRTARAKGLPERLVIMRHAFRNAMIPITTIVAFDFASLIGGAVITETIFGWKGMGELFNTGLKTVDPAPVMGFFIVTGTAAVFMNMVADLMYAYIDPRIRR